MKRVVYAIVLSAVFTPLVFLALSLLWKVLFPVLSIGGFAVQQSKLLFMLLSKERRWFPR